MIEGEFEDELSPDTLPEPPPVLTLPPTAEERAALHRTASATNLRAAEILETLKKSNRPPTK